MGIIDTLSAGFSAVNRRLWVIAIPVLLDLFLWLGPKLNAAGPVQRFFDYYADLVASSSSGLAGQYLAASGQADATAQAAQLGEQLRDANFFDVLAWQPPSLMYAHVPNTPAGLFNMPVFSVNRGLVLVGLILGMGFLSLLIQSAYFSGLVHAVRAGESTLKSIPGKVVLNWLRLIGLFALLVGVIVILGTPIVSVVTLLSLVSPVVGSLMGGLVLAFVMWLTLYLFFTQTAMFVNDEGPLRAAWHSFNVVRRHFWSAVGLIVLMLVIRLGMSKVWELLLGNPAGVSTAILANAYLDAGLAAAGMIYFRDRYLKWQETQKAKLV